SPTKKGEYKKGFICHILPIHQKSQVLILFIFLMPGRAHRLNSRCNKMPIKGCIDHHPVGFEDHDENLQQT
ncbi:hypothetical protein ABFO83_17895, partial [Acinetobacter baumannii]